MNMIGLFHLIERHTKADYMREFRLSGLLYDRDFKQTLSLDSVAQTGVTSNVSEIKFRPAIGISNENEKLVIHLLLYKTIIL